MLTSMAYASKRTWGYPEDTLDEWNGAPEPLTYYYRGGALSETIAATREQRGAPLVQAASD